MKTIPSKHKKIEAADRDNIIGRAISSTLSKAASVGQCPTAEQLAAFVDGCDAEAERDHILGHLAACDRCREIYLLAHDLSRPDAVQRGHRGWYMAGGALAAAALVILVIKLTIQQPGTFGQQVARAPASLPRVALAPPAVLKPQATSTHDSQPQSQTDPFTSSTAARQLVSLRKPQLLKPWQRPLVRQYPVPTVLPATTAAKLPPSRQVRSCLNWNSGWLRVTRNGPDWSENGWFPC